MIPIYVYTYKPVTINTIFLFFWLIPQSHIQCAFFTITALIITIVSTSRLANEIGRPRSVVTTQTTFNGKMKTKNRLQGESDDVIWSARRDRCFEDSYVNYKRRMLRVLLNANFQIANKTIIVHNSMRTRWPHAICTSFIVPYAI